MTKKNFLPFLCLMVIFFSAIVFFLRPSQRPQQTQPPQNSQPQKKLSFRSLLPILKKNQTITLLAVGDIMLGRFVNVQTRKNNDWRYPFLKTAEFTKNADISFGNLEAPFFDNCPVTSVGMIFCAPPQAVEGLKFAGFDVLSIANNHILNYGQKGLGQTQKLLKQNQILFSPNLLYPAKSGSAGRSGANTPNNLTIYQSNNLTIGFLSFDLTSGQKSLPREALAKWGQTSPTVDILIVSLHWGNEYQLQPAKWQVDLAHQIIDAGAKVIIGHHPHVTQPTEKYHDGLIFYSLGNFIFDQDWSQPTKKGKIAKIVFAGKEIESFEEIPIYIKNNSQPDLNP